MREDPAFLETEAKLHAQVEDVLELYKPKEDAKTKAKANVLLDNSLDLKSMGAEYKEGKATKQPRHVVIAFLSIAWEAMERGRAATIHLQTQLQHEEYHLKVEEHNLRAWVANQKSAAEHKIRLEKERIGRTMDEVNHLQHIYQDAVAKETAYQKQSNFLIAEHQLQSTPPLMPAVAAAALSDTQYHDALNKLDTYRTKALAIMKQSQKGIQSRNHLISLGNDWVNRSETALRLWETNQNKIVTKRLADRAAHIAAVKRRIENVQVIVNDATEKHKAYLASLKKMDLEAQIAALKQQAAVYKNVTTINAYDTGKIRAFRQSIDLELNTLKKELKANKANETVTPPPAAWGVLAGFHPPGLHPATPYPALHLPVFQPPALSPVGAEPSPAQMYPGSTVQAFSNPYPWGQEYNAGMYAPMTNNPGTRLGLPYAQQLPAVPAAATPATPATATPKFRELPPGVPPPPQDDLPPPPSMDTDLMG